jgi:hypothetical protein
MLRVLGHDAPARDHYAVSAFRSTMALAVFAQAMSAARRNERPADAMLRDLLARRHHANFRTLHIESPRFIRNADDISATDLAPLTEPGSVAISVTHAGDLLWLRASAPRRMSSARPAPAVSDQDLLVRAGLDPSAFTPGAPDFVLPGVTSVRALPGSARSPGSPTLGCGWRSRAWSVASCRRDPPRGAA